MLVGAENDWGFLRRQLVPLSKNLGYPSAVTAMRTAAAKDDAASAVIVRDDCISFLRSMPPESVDVIVTDPAYSGMNEHMKFGHGRIVGHYQRPGNTRWFTEFNDDPDTFRAFLEECHRVLRDQRHVFIMFDSFSLLSLAPLVRERFEVKNLLVWDKVNLGMGHYFRRRHEHIVFATKGHRRLSRRDLPDVLTHRRIHRAAYPTQKPVGLFWELMRGSVEPGHVVCDPFVGSGSTAIAALHHGCSFVGADLSDTAVALASERCDGFLATGVDRLEPGWSPPGDGRPA